MGFSNKKTKTVEDTTKTENAVTTRQNPAFVEDAIKGFTGKVTGLMDQDPLNFVAGADPLQTQAGKAASGLGGYQAGLTDATGVASRLAGATTGKIGASSLLTGLQDYMSPYTQNVVDTTLSDMDVDAGRTRAAQAASAARNNAFGGSRFGVREAQTEGELSRARATADAQLRDTAFNTGASLSNSDAERRQGAAVANQGAESADLARQLSAGGLMGQLAEASGAGARADVSAQMDAGGALRDVANQRAQAPIGLMGAVGDLLGQGQFPLFNGSTVDGTTHVDGTTTATSSGGLMDAIGKAIQTAAAVAPMVAMSDANLKTDVETLGHDDRGRRWVSWRYLWEPEGALRHTGVMAQEIATSDPDAVLVGPLGFLMVDYSKLEGAPWQHS